MSKKETIEVKEVKKGTEYTVAKFPELSSDMKEIVREDSEE